MYNVNFFLFSKDNEHEMVTMQPSQENIGQVQREIHIAQKIELIIQPLKIFIV